MTIEALYQEARIRASSVVPDEARQSLPIPVLRNNKLQVDFLFAPNFLSATTGEMLYTPSHQISFDVESGALLELRKVSPAYYGINQQAGQEIGMMALPDGMDASQFLAHRQRLLVLCDTLFDAFRRNDSSDASKDLAIEYRRLFSYVSEPPLHVYYKARGQEFFQWMENLIKSP